MVFVSRRLGRSNSHRKALFKNLTKSLIEHERIMTTTPKAKELRKFADKMIALGKRGTFTHMRRAYDFLQSKPLVNKLFTTFADRYRTRNGGYTRIVRVSEQRRNDRAEMCYIEYIDNNLPWQFKELQYPMMLHTLLKEEKQIEETQQNTTNINNLD